MDSIDPFTRSNQVVSMKSTQQQLEELRKENFFLKLRLYFLEKEKEKYARGDTNIDFQVDIKNEIEIQDQMINEALKISQLNETRYLEAKKAHEIFLQKLQAILSHHTDTDFLSLASDDDILRSIQLSLSHPNEDVKSKNSELRLLEKKCDEQQKYINQLKILLQGLQERLPEMEESTLRATERVSNDTFKKSPPSHDVKESDQSVQDLKQYVLSLKEEILRNQEIINKKDVALSNLGQESKNSLASHEQSIQDLKQYIQSLTKEISRKQEIIIKKDEEIEFLSNLDQKSKESLTSPDVRESEQAIQELKLYVQSLRKEMMQKQEIINKKDDDIQLALLMIR